MERKCIEVRWHGRGGQGAVTAAMILAQAAYYDGYKGVTAAPFFGAERRGAPVIATNRFAREPIRTFSLVEHPDVVVVLDETLLRVVDVSFGVRPDGIVLINSSKAPEEFVLKNPVNVATTNAEKWARESGLIVAGSVLFNTTILGGFAKATGLICQESIEKALRNHFSGEAGEKKCARSAPGLCGNGSHTRMHPGLRLIIAVRETSELWKEDLMSSENIDKFTYAHSTLCKGEAGKTGDWRSSRPEIDHTKCTPTKNQRPSCFICWLYCPEGVVKRSIPVEIDLDYCKGCGICAEECPTKAIQMIEEIKEV